MSIRHKIDREYKRVKVETIYEINRIQKKIKRVKKIKIILSIAKTGANQKDRGESNVNK